MSARTASDRTDACEQGGAQTAARGAGKGPIAGWIGALLLFSIAFWKLRIFDSGTNPGVGSGSGDLYTEHYPMAKFGFDLLASGQLPLWNPHQLCGSPFQAVPYVGLFYPPNLVYAALSTPVAIELSYVLHIFWAGACMFGLGRSLSFSSRGAFIAALTFMCSGWMTSTSNQASIVSGMCWLPFTVWMVELTIRRRLLAPFGLIAAVCLQILNGATEVFVQNMYLCGVFTLFRLGQLTTTESALDTLRRGGILLACVAVGVLLAAPQLLPSISLLDESVRGSTELSFRQARRMGYIHRDLFMSDALSTGGKVTVGVLPLAGLVLAAGVRKKKVLWLFCIFIVVVSAHIVFGGPAFYLYREMPLGDLFRRPMKFLHLYAFAQALLAGLAVLMLEGRLGATRREVARSLPLLLAILFACLGSTWLAARGEVAPYLIGLAIGLVLFAASKPGAARLGSLWAILLLQSTNLFFGVSQPYMRPLAQPEKIHHFDRLHAELASMSEEQRVYIAPDIHFQPGLMQKSGMVGGYRVVGDYQPLASFRAASFFDTAAPYRGRRGPFNGAFSLSARTHFEMMDLTSTRFYVVRRGTPEQKTLAAQAEQPGRLATRLVRDRFPLVYERPRALPRAYFVRDARHLDEPKVVLDSLKDPTFDARREVILEGVPAMLRVEALRDRGHDEASNATVVITSDLREEVVFDVTTDAPGYVILTDAYHSGWEARKGEEAAPIYRANYLFRAVPVEEGDTTITMTYRSTPLRRGLVISGVTAVLLALIASLGWTRRYAADESGARAG